MRISVSLILLLAVSILLQGEIGTEVRAFDQQALAEYQESPEFDYTSDYAKSGSWVNLLLIYLFDLIARFFEATGAGWLTPYLFRILIVVVLLGVLYYIVKNRYGSVFDRDGQSYAPTGIVVENGESVNYEELISESLVNQEYKMAIRYQFLKCLNDLNANGVVKITQWKAPLDYVDELPIEKQSPFEELTRLFEVTWYGDYEADIQSFEACRTSAKQLAS